MTLKIEIFSRKRGTRIQLSGELRSEHLEDVRAEIKRSDPRVILDLDEVDLLDVDAVRFLNACEAQDVEVVNCSPYIREWMFQEREQEKKNSERS
jgi:anti-anti-sigma regulatory factor